jgi:8-oxo-dGTP pyrophosphatase MutT (NUDIX family)
MREELGVTIDDWELLGEVQADSFHRRDTIHCYRVEVASPEFSFARAELSAAGWFRLDQLPTDLKSHVPPILALLDGASH